MQDNQQPVNPELDGLNIASVHTGGMRMDDESPSYDIYDDPFVMTRDGSKRYVSTESARQAQAKLNASNDDGNGWGMFAE